MLGKELHSLRAGAQGHINGAQNAPLALQRPLHSRRLQRKAARQLLARGLAREILTEQAAQIEGDPLEFLKVTEAYWKALRNSKDEPGKPGPKVVKSSPNARIDHHDFDVVVCGGTLGLLLATTLQLRGHSVCVVDKRLIQGRTQEWNISRGELEALTESGLLNPQELEQCIVSEFNPVRVGFAGGPEIWVRDVLNLGISPRVLLDMVRDKFLAAGGVIMENVSFKSAEVMQGGVRLMLSIHAPGVTGLPVSLTDVNRPNGLGTNASNFVGPFTMPDGSDRVTQQQQGAAYTNGNGASNGTSRNGAASAAAQSSNGVHRNGAAAAAGNGDGSSNGAAPPKPGRMMLRTRLLLDCMGHYSDIVKQMRGRSKPEGIVLVVGSCAEGFPTDRNTFGDLLYTIDDAKDDMQVFWEAFPAEGGSSRTTYMFAYSDAEPERPTFEALLDRYFESIQPYQGVDPRSLQYKRVLFGGFPCWPNGPLQPQWDHILQVGDASATQSPLSFGGFGAMLRHLTRLTEGLDDALRCNALTKGELGWLHPYQPSLSSSWLFQRSMSVGVGQLKQASAADQQQQQVTSSNGTSSRRTSWVQLPPDHVNQVLACNFSVMKVLGDRVLRPFLQDTIQLVPLSLSMTGMMLANPVAITRVLFQVGPRNLAGWFFHYSGLLVYTLLHVLSTPVRSLVRGAARLGNAAAANITAENGFSVPITSSRGRPRSSFWLRRLLDTWEYGSGSDYRYHLPSDPAVKPAITTFGSDATAATPAPPSLQPVPVPAAASAGNGAYAAAATAAAATAAAAYSNGNGSGNGAYSGSNGSYSGSAGNGGYGTGGNGSTEAPLVPQPVAVPVSASIGSNSGGTK